MQLDFNNNTSSAAKVRDMKILSRRIFLKKRRYAQILFTLNNCPDLSKVTYNKLQAERARLFNHIHEARGEWIHIRNQLGEQA